MTVPFDNLSYELIYSCITLSVFTLFIIVLIAASAITTAANIALLTTPLAFSKPDFFVDIPILFFTPPVTSLSRSRRYSPCCIGMRCVRGDYEPRSVDRSIGKIPADIQARSMQRACTDRIPIDISGCWRNCSNKNRKYRTNWITYVATNRLSAPKRLGLPPLVVAE